MFKKNIYLPLFLALTLTSANILASLRDPTQPLYLNFDQNIKTGIAVDFVLMAKERQIVSINGQILTIGSPYMNGKIAAITSEYIVLKTSEEEKKLPIQAIAIKKTFRNKK